MTKYDYHVKALIETKLLIAITPYIFRAIGEKTADKGLKTRNSGVSDHELYILMFQRTIRGNACLRVGLETLQPTESPWALGWSFSLLGNSPWELLIKENIFLYCARSAERCPILLSTVRKIGNKIERFVGRILRIFCPHEKDRKLFCREVRAVVIAGGKDARAALRLPHKTGLCSKWI